MNTVTVTFKNVGRYAMTIGAEKVPPGGTCRFSSAGLPVEWDRSELEVELRAPEEAGVEYRNPLGLITWAERES